MKSIEEKLKEATLCFNEAPDQAYAILHDVLKEDPENCPANTLAGVIQTRAGRYGAALAYFTRARELRPDKAEMWNNLGTIYHEIKKPAKAREYFRRALQLKPNDPLYMTNIGVTYSDEGNPHECLRWVAKVKKINPALPSLAHAEAFASLAVGDWATGWKAYESTLGGRFRKQLDFGGQDWDGSKVGTLVVYGEQGLGDEIMYASCIEDCRALADHVIIECDPRLESIYRRSFPWAEVFGSRRLDRPWLEGRKIDAQVACGTLPSLFRASPESCPRTPYIVADAERRLMWRSLFRSWGKPAIGINWTGGRYASQSNKRTMGLESFRPLIEATDAVFVSLQYEDPSEEIAASGLPVRWFWETMKDRPVDDAAALIAELDDMIGIHSTVHHLRGAMGLPSRVFVPHASMWLYQYGDRIPFYKAQTFIRQKKDERWIDCVRRSL